MCTPHRIAFAFLALIGCAPSGEDPLSRLDTYSPLSGEYVVRYLSPPWELARSDGTTAHLRIRSNLMNTAGVEAGPGKYELLVTVEPGTVTDRIAAEQGAAMARGERTLEAPHSITTARDLDGQEFSTTVDPPMERQHRYVFFPLDASRVVRLGFDATPNLDTAEVDSMIDAFEIGPAE
jgi:hypothetical protein